VDTSLTLPCVRFLTHLPLHRERVEGYCVPGGGAGSARHGPGPPGAVLLLAGRNDRLDGVHVRLAAAKASVRRVPAQVRLVWLARQSVRLTRARLGSGRLFPEHAKSSPLSAANAPPDELRSRSVWVTHGEADGTTPVALARESMQTAAALFGGGDDAEFAARVVYQPHSGGHEIPRVAMRNAAAAMKRWFV